MGKINIVEVTDLKKNFNELCVLKGIDFTVLEGETVSIIGPSGSGKSTFLRCLIELEKAEHGEIKISGKSLCKDGSYYKDKATSDVIKQMGMVFQNFNLFPHMSVKGNLLCAPKLLESESKQVLEKRCEEMLIKVGLLDKIDVMPSKLSGGQKQRVAIARALMLNPKILLFDEPTSALDPELTKEVLEVIKNLSKENITMIIVTHEIEFAKEASDKVVFMDNGLVVEQGTPLEVIENPRQDRTKAFLQKLS